MDPRDAVRQAVATFIADAEKATEGLESEHAFRDHAIHVARRLKDDILQLLGTPEDLPDYWVLKWREGEDWGWLRSLDGNDECTTIEPAQRLRYASKARAMSALWKFRAQNAPREGETIRLVHVRVRGRQGEKS